MIFISIFFYSCTTPKAFDVEDEMIGGPKDVTKSPIGVFWPSLETTSRKARKKSESLIASYYSLFYIPENNELHITSIANNQTSEINIKDASSPSDIVLVSEFKGTNIYKIFFNDKRSKKIESIITKKKKENKIRRISIKALKITEDPEVMVKKIILKKIKAKLSEKIKAKYMDKDYELNTNFLVLKVYDFIYKNIQKTIEFKFDYIFIGLRVSKPDYASNLGTIEDSIASNMENATYKEAQKFNDIYKNIVPDKAKYYKNAYNINMKLDDKMGAVLVLIDQIENTDNLKQDKKNVKVIKKIFKKELKRRDWNRFNGNITKNYRNYLRGKLKKGKFIEILKNLVIEYSLD